MPRKLWLLPVAALVLGSISYVAWPKRPTTQDLARHRVRQLAFWQSRLERPLNERFEAAPADLIEYLVMDNEVNRFESRPVAAPMTPEFRATLVATIQALPPRLAGMVDDKLLGIFTVKGLGSTAYTDFVRDAEGHAVAAFVGLDVDALTRKGNDWLTWKESSPFRADPTWRVEGRLAEEGNDTVDAAIAFVLVHELAHVVAFDEDVHPLWSLAPKLVDPAEFPFMALSWGVTEGRYTRLAEQRAPLPGPIVYYKPSVERPTAAAALAYYDWLAATDFVTLYAATNPFDDFADAVATYLHTVVAKKPFEIRLYENDALRRTVTACWNEPRCAAKRRALEEILGLDQVPH